MYLVDDGCHKEFSESQLICHAARESERKTEIDFALEILKKYRIFTNTFMIISIAISVFFFTLYCRPCCAGENRVMLIYATLVSHVLENS